MDSKTLHVLMLPIAAALFIASGILIFAAMQAHTYGGSLVCASTGSAAGGGGVAFLAAWFVLASLRRG